MLKYIFKIFSLRRYVALLRTWRRRCFHGINGKILMLQIFEVRANENACNKHNELEYILANVFLINIHNLKTEKELYIFVFY